MTKFITTATCNWIWSCHPHRHFGESVSQKINAEQVILFNFMTTKFQGNYYYVPINGGGEKVPQGYRAGGAFDPKAHSVP